MKSSFKIILPLTVLGALVWIGCDTQYPTSYTNIKSAGAMVINFENGLGVNPGLAEANRPNNLVQTAGTALIANPYPTTWGSGTLNLVSPGAANTSTCAHVTGTVIDPGTAVYPSIQLQVPLDKAAAWNSYYDASLFSGVQFYVKVNSDDTAGKRVFSIPIAQTQPPANGGTCNPSASSNACYNDFFNTFSGTNGSWQLLTFSFASFTRGAYGAAVTPTTLSGSNLQQILMLDWTESNNNVAGTINVDFYVDEVQFY